MKYLAAAAVLFVLLWAQQGQPRAAVPPEHFRAVRHFWKDRADRVEAFNILWCESRYSIWATNGQYLGAWQAGSWMRSTYGFGWDIWSQTRAAWLYWRTSRWSGWECA